MNLGRCMLRECKTCKFETRCFKEYQNEYTKNKNNRIKTSKVQSKKRSKAGRRRISKNLKKYNGVWMCNTTCCK